MAKSESLTASQEIWVFLSQSNSITRDVKNNLVKTQNLIKIQDLLFNGERVKQRYPTAYTGIRCCQKDPVPSQTNNSIENFAVHKNQLKHIAALSPPKLFFKVSHHRKRYLKKTRLSRLFSSHFARSLAIMHKAFLLPSHKRINRENR